MKARVLVEVGDYERYVIARYFAAAATERRDKTRTRATRAQVVRFVRGAIRSAVREQRDALPSRRMRAYAKRLQEAAPAMGADELVPPVEQQPSLAW